jgi:hypothetical protein
MRSLRIDRTRKLLRNNKLPDYLPEIPGNPGFHRSFSVVCCYAAPLGGVGGRRQPLNIIIGKIGVVTIEGMFKNMGYFGEEGNATLSSVERVFGTTHQGTTPHHTPPPSLSRWSD